MKKRNVYISAAMIALALTAGPFGAAQALELPKMPGIGGGSSSGASVNWGDLATTGQNAQKDVIGGVYLLSMSTASIADALGFKEEAAKLRGQVKGMSEDGSTSGDYDLNETQKSSAALLQKISESTKQVMALAAVQKEEISKAMVQFGLGTMKYIVGVKGVKAVVEKAGDAPMMQMTKFVEIIKLAPTIAKGATEIIGKVPQLIKLMKQADIEIPTTIVVDITS